MIPEIRNTFLRRVVLIWTVVAIVVCLGPIGLVHGVLGWIENTFDADLRTAWNGKPKKRMK